MESHKKKIKKLTEKNNLTSRSQHCVCMIIKILQF